MLLKGNQAWSNELEILVVTPDVNIQWLRGAYLHSGMRVGRNHPRTVGREPNSTANVIFAERSK